MKDSQSQKKEQSLQKKEGKKGKKSQVIKRGVTFGQVIKPYEQDFKLVLIPLILLIILSILTLINNQMIAEIGTNSLVHTKIANKLDPYPFVQNVENPSISAKASIIIDATTQVILFSKNPQLRFSMASTTKIMTALTALDYYQNNSVLTIHTTGVQGSVLGLQNGDKLYFEDLMYAMLLPSANDAATAIADNFPGGMESFVQNMNEKALSLHLTNTHFADPTGLNDDGDYTTVIDMARLASLAIKNKEFQQITSTKQKSITTLGYGRQYNLNNLNKLLGIDGVTGIKTGTTEGAGEVLVTSTIEDSHVFIIVVMNSKDRFTDTKTLLNFIKANVKYITPSLPLL